jgi:hypothetical protein
MQYNFFMQKLEDQPLDPLTLLLSGYQGNRGGRKEMRGNETEHMSTSRVYITNASPPSSVPLWKIAYLLIV